MCCGPPRAEPGRAAHIPGMTQHISDAAANARGTSRSTDGVFGTRPLSEAKIDLDTPSSYAHVSAEAAQAITQVEARGTGGSHQIRHFTGGPDEQLGDDGITTVLAGNRDDAVMSVEETCPGYISDTQRHAAEEACDGADVEWDAPDWEEQQAIVQAVAANPDAGEQLYKQGISNTRRQLVRRRLDDHSAGDFQQRAHEAGATWGQDDVRDVRVRAISEQPAGYGTGLDDDHNREALEELVDNGPCDYTEAVKPELISSNDVEDLIRGETDRTLSFTDPHSCTVGPDDRVGDPADVRAHGAAAVDAGRCRRTGGGIREPHRPVGVVGFVDRGAPPR